MALMVTSTDDQGAQDRQIVETAVYIAGDATGDGTVDIFDAVLIGRHWHDKRGTPEYSDAADLNNDGDVDILDAVTLGKHWRETAA